MDTWDTPFVLDHYSLLELKFWQDNIKARNVRICQQFCDSNKIVYSDASNHACAALVFETEHIAHTKEETVTNLVLVIESYLLFSSGLHPLNRFSKVVV